MKNIPKITQSERLLSWSQFPFASRSKRKITKKKSGGSYQRKFGSLARLVDDANISLAENDSSLRIRVYEKEEDVVMDILALDNNKHEQKKFKRIITNENSNNLVRQIHHRMGLVLDYSV